jgi:hypothetical protein
MKKINVLLSAFAFTIAIVGAYAANGMKENLASAWYVNSSSNCVSGTLDSGTCDTPTQSTRCTINIASHPEAFKVRNGTQCEQPLYIQP